MSTTAPSPSRPAAVERDVLDVLGVGVGPFNLGLAAMLDGSAPDLASRFLERGERFAWHPGMLLEGTTLQVPFLADLVTLADPTSRWSFLAYLHDRDRLFPFYLQERFHVPRAEYDDYCRWVAERLPSCAFGREVRDVSWDAARGALAVRVAVHEPRATADPAAETDPEAADPAAVHEETVHARSLVLGIGSAPHVPDAFAGLPDERAFHSARYRDRRETIAAGEHVVVVGSGQSGGEIVLDLLRRPQEEAVRVTWLARTPAFAPMEYSKLGLEHFTPEYARWFHGLPEGTRDDLRAGQDLLYKGISAETSDAIYDALYERTVDHPEPGAAYAAGFELVRVDTEPGGDRARGSGPGGGRGLRLHLRHVDDGSEVEHRTDLLVLATGYEPTPLPLEDPASVLRDRQGRPEITLDHRIRRADGAASTLFVQNGELHTHGVGAPDLGLGARRNAVITNQLAGREVYRVPDRTVFQHFGADPLRSGLESGRPGGQEPTRFGSGSESGRPHDQEPTRFGTGGRP